MLPTTGWTEELSGASLRPGELDDGLPDLDTRPVVVDVRPPRPQSSARRKPPFAASSYRTDSRSDATCSKKRAVSEGSHTRSSSSGSVVGDGIHPTLGRIGGD